MKAIITVYVNGIVNNGFVSDPKELGTIEMNDLVDKATNSDSSLVFYRGKTAFYFRKEILNNSVISISEVE